MEQLTHRNRRMLAPVCVFMGIGFAQIGLVCWALRNGGLDGLTIIVVGLIPATIFGLVFGMLAILVVPVGLSRKPTNAIAKKVFIGTSALLGSFTFATGIFPLPVAGVCLCAVTLWLMVHEPNQPIVWSPRQCIACSYDLRASGPDRCPECGLSALDIQVAVNSGLFPRATAFALTWVSIVLLAWVVATVHMVRTMGNPFP
jgi:hypothetical protein